MRVYLYIINAQSLIERSYSTVVVLCTYGEHFPALCKGPEFEPRWDQPVLLSLFLHHTRIVDIYHQPQR